MATWTNNNKSSAPTWTNVVRSGFSYPARFSTGRFSQAKFSIDATSYTTWTNQTKNSTTWTAQNKS